MMNTNKKHRVLLISAPSGAGKSTIIKRLLKEFPEIRMSISHTTRAPRSGEIDSQHYYFIDKDEFQNLVGKGCFLEWAKVHDNWYGTTKEELERIVAGAFIPLIEIDVQGWLQIKEKISNVTSIFVLPPSLKILWERLERRGTDSLATRKKRLKNALEEIEKAQHYQHIVINEDLDRAYREVRSIVIEQLPNKVDNRRGIEHCMKLREEFLKADWINSLS